MSDLMFLGGDSQRPERELYLEIFDILAINNIQEFNVSKFFDLLIENELVAITDHNELAKYLMNKDITAKAKVVYAPYISLPYEEKLKILSACGVIPEVETDIRFIFEDVSKHGAYVPSDLAKPTDMNLKRLTKRLKYAKTPMERKQIQKEVQELFTYRKYHKE